MMGTFRVREKSIKIMCTEIEKLQIEKLAAENNMNIGNYMRKMALEGYIINVDFSELKQLVYEVNRIGNNVNQIAHHVNTNKTIFKSDIEDINKQIASIWTLLRAELFSYKR